VGNGIRKCTVVYMCSYIFLNSRALTRQTMSAVREVVGRLVLKLRNHSTHWYTFLCVMQFHPFCANSLLLIWGGFSLSGHKNRMTSRRSTVVQSESGADMITWLRICRVLPVTVSPSAWGLGEELTTPRRKMVATQYCKGRRPWTDSLERSMKQKMGMRIGTWNIGSL
jgi:hypothetical protein